MRFHGKIFQRYVEQLVDQILARDPNTQYVKHSDVVYRDGKQELRSSDMIIRKGDSLFLFEVSATRMQAKRTIGQGNITTLENDIQKMVIGNVKSLQTCISNLKVGNLQLQGIDINEVKRFYPIVVMLEGFPKHPAIQVFLTDLAKKGGYFVAEDIAPLTLLNVEDLEEIEGYTTENFFKILFDSISGESFSQLALADFIKRKYPKIAMRSKWLDGLTNQIFNEATLMFFGKPLSGIGLHTE